MPLRPHFRNGIRLFTKPFNITRTALQTGWRPFEAFDGQEVNRVDSLVADLTISAGRGILEARRAMGLSRHQPNRSRRSALGRPSIQGG
jgi:hypothetical protein